MARLFVGNIPFQSNEEQLREWFTQSGVAVESVDLIRDRFSGELRGFGFVELEPAQEVERVIQACNGQRFMGRPLVIDQARSRTDGAAGLHNQTAQRAY
ncbi:MAG: RNA-binding protein [Bryobacterales bacterium]|nr:RNA-binding protein [Bryobacterales bacterium]